MHEPPHRARNQKNGETGLPQSCGYALLFCAGTALLLLPLAAAVSYAQADPVKLALPASMAVLYLSAAVCGAVAARKAENALLASGICGVLLLLLTAVSALFAGTSSICGLSVPGAVAAHLCVPAAVFAGGFIGKRRVRKPSAHGRRSAMHRK